jgi:hypothetical protein
MHSHTHALLYSPAPVYTALHVHPYTGPTPSFSRTRLSAPTHTHTHRTHLLQCMCVEIRVPPCSDSYDAVSCIARTARHDSPSEVMYTPLTEPASFFCRYTHYNTQHCTGLPVLCRAHYLPTLQCTAPTLYVICVLARRRGCCCSCRYTGHSCRRCDCPDAREAKGQGHG